MDSADPHNNFIVLSGENAIKEDMLYQNKTYFWIRDEYQAEDKNLSLLKEYPYKNEKVAARLQLGCCYYAAIKYVCNNWWRQSSQLERLVACLQQPCSFYQRLQAHRATTRSQLQLATVTSKTTARTHSL